MKVPVLEFRYIYCIQVLNFVIYRIFGKQTIIVPVQKLHLRFYFSKFFIASFIMYIFFCLSIFTKI